MNREDREIAAKCGMSPAEAQRTFEQAALRDQNRREFYERMYRKRPDDDPGETQRQHLERYLRYD